MRVAYLMLGSNDVAEDLVHDVFIRCGDRVLDLDHPLSYLRACVVNACRHEHRRRARFVELGDDSLESVMQPRAIELRDALLHLSPRKRAAVVLRFFEDLPFERVAETLGCTPSTARSLVRRATRELRGVIDV